MQTKSFLVRSMSHFKCLATGESKVEGLTVLDKPYLHSEVFRFKVPEGKVSWKEPFEGYKPLEYTDPKLKGQSYADKDVGEGDFKWNELDGKINRRSHNGDYQIDSSGRPLNPIGRTGISGRGFLGRWGPNHAADPVVSRIKDGKLQFVGIQRRDTGEWALPGGMVDAGEEVSETLKREFTEETLDGVESADIKHLWKKGKLVYKGYVDDPRNTDNAWMETVVMNFHDEDGVLEKVKFKAGDDAANVCFITVEPNVPLYASHNDFVKMFAKFHGVEI